MSHLIGRRGHKSESYPGGAGAAGAVGDHKVLVDGTDTTPDYLGAKVVQGSNITVTPVDLGGGDLALSISAVVPPGSSDHKVLVDASDTTASFLLAKLAAGIGISLAVLNPGGDEQVEITADGNFANENISTSGSASVGPLTATSIIDSGLGLGVVHSSAGGAFTSSLIVNADVAAGAAISVSKLAPGSNGQALLTSGGSAVWGLIANANIDPTAAIAVSKLAPGADGQALVTAGGAPVWGTVPSGGLTPGAVNTVFVTNAGGTAVVTALLLNANVDPAAAILGTKISPNFGSQNVITTGNVQLKNNSGVFQIGVDADVATSGVMRTFRGSFDWKALSASGLQVQNVLSYDTTGSTITVGGVTSGQAFTTAALRGSSTAALQGGSTAIEAQVGSNGVFTLTGIPTARFAASVANPTWEHAAIAAATGQKFTVAAQDTGGATGIAGILILRGGRQQNVTSSGAAVAGDVWISEGDVAGGTAKFGNILHHTFTTENMHNAQRVDWYRNAVAAPDAPNVSGMFEFTWNGARLTVGPSGYGCVIGSGGDAGAAAVPFYSHSAPFIAKKIFSGAQTKNLIDWDLSATTQDFPQAVDNLSGQVICHFIGKTTAASATPGACCRLWLMRGFKIVAGTLTMLDATAIVLGTNFTDAALAGVSADIVASGTHIQCSFTNVAGESTNVNAYFWLMPGGEPS